MDLCLKEKRIMARFGFDDFYLAAIWCLGWMTNPAQSVFRQLLVSD
jgi:hypothetical protein